MAFLAKQKTDFATLAQGAAADQKEYTFARRYKGHRNLGIANNIALLGGHSEYLVSGSDDGNLFLWDLNTGKSRASQHIVFVHLQNTCVDHI